jgi:hypothetical protein
VDGRSSRAGCNGGAPGQGYIRRVSSDLATPAGAACGPESRAGAHLRVRYASANRKHHEDKSRLQSLEETRQSWMPVCDPKMLPNAEGNFMALEATSGKVLRRFQCGASVYSSPMSFGADGKQYLAIAAGSARFTFALP